MFSTIYTHIFLSLPVKFMFCTVAVESGAKKWWKVMEKNEKSPEAVQI